MKHNKSHNKSTDFGKLVFDSTNIGENYPGTTMPLTYSFIRHAYKEVYTGFLRLLGSNEAAITTQSFAISNLLGYVQGRVFYNLTNWYRLLKMLPFYSTIKVFFNRMLLPVKSESSADLEPSKASLYSSLLFILAVVFPQIHTTKFEKGFKVLTKEFTDQSWDTYSTLELIYRFEKLRDSFFRLWSKTIVNDFHVMVFWGILVSLANKTYHKPQFYLNSLTNKNMVPESIEPLLALQKLALHINQSNKLKRLFKHQPQEILKQINIDQSFPELKVMFNNYVQAYGNRSGQELKLEIPKFSEQPEQIIILLKQYLESPTKNMTTPTTSITKVRVKQPVLIPLTSLIKHIAIKGVYRREKYRLMRGHAYSFARSSFLELGQRLTTSKLINNPSDIFYLTYDELSALCLYHSPPNNPSELIKIRKAQLATFDNSWLDTRITKSDFNIKAQLKKRINQKRTHRTLSGTGTSITSPVTAKVIVMEEFSVDIPVNNCILVTKKTDPGWTILFPLLKGIITETGSTLSHASIIARELQIPCITQVPHCTKLLQTGDTITLDPESGTIVINKLAT